jgi:hypothetical protein
MVRNREKMPRSVVSTSRVKQPQTVVGPLPGSKQPRSAPGALVSRDEVMHRRPTWKFSNADHDSRWNFAGVSGSELVTLLAKLGSFESMTIREIFYTGEEPGKEYDVESLPPGTRQRLTEIGRDDETKLARLRLAGECRLYGFMREHVFHVLWWDPHHQVFPSHKRHT